MDPSLRTGFMEGNTVERCYLTSVLLGDTWGIKLWTIVNDMLACKTDWLLQSPKADVPVSLEHSPMLDEAPVAPAEATQPPKLISGSSSLGLLRSQPTMQRDLRTQLEAHSQIQQQTGLEYSLTSRLVTEHVFVGASDQAVQLLMQTAVSSPNHYADALRACLIASLKRPETAISTIKVESHALAKPHFLNYVTHRCPP
eukprot:m.172775 g.172775  ORF g.172775 m.172775 type:complete len:199 (-) comp16726_c0_seq22:60-656(-)